MTVHEVDPLQDDRWVELVERSPGSSLFHSRAWIAALSRTYGYQPVAFTTAAEGEPLRDALLFCRVNSWLTGRRLVSLPFSDHCDVLVDDPTVLAGMLETVARRTEEHCRYIELRPARPLVPPSGYVQSTAFVWHSVDLRRSVEDIHSALHRSHTRRAIRKAERSGVAVVAGRSEDLIRGFYRVHAATRCRHGVPVQPHEWFRRLTEEFGDRLQIYAATYHSAVIAAILVIRHKTTLVYKYGGSDIGYRRYGATPALFWRAIVDGVSTGCEEFDLGRSDVDDDGLIAFKDHLGAASRPLVYYRYSQDSTGNANQRWRGRPRGRAGRVVTSMLIRTGWATRLYKHFA